MTPMLPKKWIAVSIHSLRHGSRDVGFDLYLRLSEENYAHVFSKTSGLDYLRLAQYRAKGVESLYITEQDEPLYHAYCARRLDQVVSNEAESYEKRVAALLNLTEQNLVEISTELVVSQESFERSKQVVRGFVQLMTEKPETLGMILKLVSRGDYFYFHSIAVSIFSLYLGKAIGEFDQQTLEWIALGGFLHDVGMIQLPLDIEEDHPDLSLEHQQRIWDHPRIGMRMLEQIKSLPKEVRYIVYQHHEEPGGEGYPNGLQWKAIYPPAHVVGIADHFSSLISKRSFRPAMTAEQAVQSMLEQPQKFKSEYVKALAAIFSRKSGPVAQSA